MNKPADRADTKARAGKRKPGGDGGKNPAGSPARKPTRRATNLTLDPEAVARGERFGRRHGSSLSQLVNDFLHALPVEEDDEALTDLTPPVRRLYGIAAGSAADRGTHRAHLLEKYGGQRSRRP